MPAASPEAVKAGGNVYGVSSGVGEIVGILLAAGESSRFGGDKLAHPLAEGRPMAVVAARSLVPACDRVIAVWRPGREALAKRLAAAGCDTLCCAEAGAGLGHSLAAAVRASAEAAGWVVALADMPFIETATHRRVVEELRSGARIVTVELAGRRGHPVGFSSACYEELVGLTGDQGARKLLDSGAADIRRLALTDPGILQDIDTPADLPLC